MHKPLVVFFYSLVLTACSSAPYHDLNNPTVEIAEIRVDISDTPNIKQILNQQYKDWHHVQYRRGGTSKKGIDCSGLAYLTYRTKFGIDLPRTTEYQSKAGQSIQQDQLRAGDMVFFKTGVFTRHVGIYIDGGDFLHASSSKGVIISNLEDPYWASAYWKAQRIR